MKWFCKNALNTIPCPLLAGASEAAFNRVRDAVRIPMYGKHRAVTIHMVTVRELQALSQMLTPEIERKI